AAAEAAAAQRQACARAAIAVADGVGVAAAGVIVVAARKGGAELADVGAQRGVDAGIGEAVVAFAAHAQGDAVAEAAPVPGLPGGGIAVVAVQPAGARPAHAQGVVGQARRKQRAAAV